MTNRKSKLEALFLKTERDLLASELEALRSDRAAIVRERDNLRERVDKAMNQVFLLNETNARLRHALIETTLLLHRPAYLSALAKREEVGMASWAS